MRVAAAWQESLRPRRIADFAMLRTIFGFEMPTRLLFGQGAVENLGFECSLNGWASALIVTDAGVHRAGLTQPVEAQLQAQGVRYSLYTGVVPNPTIESIEAAVPDAQAVDVVIAVGGGSVMDSAKLINAIRTHGGRVRDYEGTDTVPAPCKPLVAIPTTAGTGSEVTFIAMFTDAGKRQKMPVLSRHLAPHLAIVDPEMTRHLPPDATAQTGLDALTHASRSDCRPAGEPVLGHAGVRGDTADHALFAARGRRRQRGHRSARGDGVRGDDCGRGVQQQHGRAGARDWRTRWAGCTTSRTGCAARSRCLSRCTSTSKADASGSRKSRR
jgi:hypothetical protein